MSPAILLLQTIPMLRKKGPRMLSVQEVRNQGNLSWIGAVLPVHTKQRQVFFRTEECGPWHPELAKVGMRVLSQVISASSCERNG